MPAPAVTTKPRRKQPPIEPKVSLAIYVTQAEYDALAERARAEGRRVGNLGRRIVQQYLGLVEPVTN